MHQTVTTLKQLTALKTETIIYAVVVMLFAVLISFIISSLIPYKGGTDRSYRARRFVFIIVDIVFSLGFWLFNQIYVMATIRNVGFQNQFAKTNLIGLVIVVIGYVLVGLLIAIILRKSKFATIFFKHKK